MTDLVKRLRERADLARHSLEGGGWRYFSTADIANYDQAASRIKELEAELATHHRMLEQLKQAAENIGQAPDVRGLAELMEKSRVGVLVDLQGRVTGLVPLDPAQLTPEDRAKALIGNDWQYFDSGTHSVMYDELEKLIAAAIRAAEDAALEKAAREAESNEEEPDTPEDEAMVAGYNRAVREIADAIRKLKTFDD